MTPQRRAQLFVESVTEYIESLSIPATPEDFAIAATVPGTAVTLDDIRTALPLLTADQQYTVRIAWLNFLTAAMSPRATRSELHKSFSPVAELLGVECRPRATNLRHLVVDSSGQYTLGGRPISDDFARRLVMDDRAVELAEGIHHGHRSRFTDDVVEALARHVSAHVAQQNVQSVQSAERMPGKFAWWVAFAATVVAVFCGWWALNVPTYNDRRAVEACIPSSAENTHFISLEQPEPKRIIVDDYELTWSPSSDISNEGIDVGDALSRNESVTLHVKGNTAPLVLRMSR